MFSGVFLKILLILGCTSAPSILASIQHSPVESDNSVKRFSRNVDQSSNACSAHPKISIVSYSRNGFKSNATVQTELINVNGPNSPKDGLVILSPFEAEVEIQCEASEPIEWEFDDPNGPRVSSIVVSRDDESCFRINISLVTTKETTGKYWCNSIGRGRSRSSWLYLYGDGNGPPFLLNNGKHLTVVPKDTKSVVLPCRVINPTLTPKLFKGESSVVLIELTTVPYNPQIGFTLDLHSNRIPDPYDTYKCVSGEGYVKILVKPTPNFRVTPSSKRVTIVESQSLTLTCEGKNPVGIQGFLDDSKATVDASGESEYKYSVTYDLKATDAQEVNCIDLKTKKVFHVWTPRIISAEADQNSGISYNGTTQKFICNSKTSDSPVISLAECNSPIDCKIADKCFTWNASYTVDNGRPDCPASIYVGSTCRSPEKGQGCAYVQLQNTVRAGVVHCTLPDNQGQSRMYFFTGLKSEATSVFSDWHQAPIEQTASLTLLQSNRTFYTGEGVLFQCTAQKFLCANGMRFMFRMENGSYVLPPTETPERILPAILTAEVDTSKIISNVRLLITDSLIREVVCLIPVWNTTDWVNVSTPISVIQSTEPRILMPETASLLPFPIGVEQSLRCEGEGIPTPQVVWYRHGRVAEHQLVGNTTDRRFSVIRFGHVDEDDEGVYTCVATNVHGQQMRNFTLTTTPGSKKGLNAAIVIGSLTFLMFIVVVTVLCKKLQKKQKIIAKLSEKEIQEFREGDSIALKNAPDGYIRAQYLPYDNEYEILQENLKIEEEMILGKGEYGIVMKGMLRQNDSLKEVAVKTIRGTDVKHFKALLSELKILTYIGWHDNVINLLGAVTRNLRDRDVYVVVEYCRLGDLESFLRNNRNNYLHQMVDDKIDLNIAFNFNAAQSYQPMHYSMSTTDLISWSYQIASGMEYLANKKVIHGDLAPRNILLTDDRTIKITDFGLSKHLYNDCSNYISHATMDLPWKLCAPEVLQYNSIFSTHSDVWAFGVTLWEIFSLGENPYPGIPFNWDFRTRLLQGYRLDKPSYSNQGIYNQILHCWKNVPAERISFMELRKYFHWLLHHWAEEPKPPILQTGNGETLNYLQVHHPPYTQMNIVDS